MARLNIFYKTLFLGLLMACITTPAQAWQAQESFKDRVIRKEIKAASVSRPKNPVTSRKVRPNERSVSKTRATKKRSMLNRSVSHRRSFNRKTFTVGKRF